MTASGPAQADAHSIDLRMSGSFLELLEEAAARDPDEVGFRAGSPRAGDGLPAELSWAEASLAVRRLAAHFAGLNLPAGVPVGIRLGNRPEAALTIMAVQAAGLLPCLLDIAHGAADLSAAIAAADIQAVVTQTALGPDRPADALCFVAAGFPRLRSILAFGPDLPQGVIGLDAVLADPRSPVAPSGPPSATSEFVTFARLGTEIVAIRRTLESVIAATEDFLAATQVGKAERLITFLPGDDLKGLVTGLAASLVARATLEAHELFDAAALLASLAQDQPPHLVVPGRIEAHLAGSGIGQRVRSATFLHEPPFALGFERCGGLVVDGLALGEQAILCVVRDGGGGLSMLRSSGSADAAAEAKVDGSGAVWVRGASVLDRTGRRSQVSGTWLSTPYRASRLQDRIFVDGEEPREPSSIRGVVAVRRNRVEAGHERSPEGAGRR